jgi:hypothetical protein
MLEPLTIETFTPHVGTSFRLVLGEAGAQQLTLSAVEALSAASAAERRTPFSLTFHTAKRGALPQAIYRLEHPSLSALELFLVPLGPDEKGMRYEAIFT